MAVPVDKGAVVVQRVDELVAIDIPDSASTAAIDRERVRPVEGGCPRLTTREHELQPRVYRLRC